MKYEHVIIIKPHVKPFRGLPSMVPFLCVFFILLLFAMVGTNLVPIQGIPVELPKAAGQMHYASRNLIVSIDKDSKYYYRDIVTDDIAVLKNAIVENYTGRSEKDERERMIIRMDTRANMTALVKLLAAAEELNVNSLFMIDPEGSSATNFMEQEQ